MVRTAAAGPALAMAALLLLSPASSNAQGSPAPLPARTPSGGCAEGALAVGSVCVSKDTASVVSVSQEPVQIGSELFAGCTATAAPRVLSSGAELVRMERTLSCAASKYHTAALAATVTDSWRAVDGAVEWNTTISSAAPHFWTTEINDAIRLPNASAPLVWTGSTTGSRLEAGSSSLDPVPLAEYTGRTYYGRDQWSSNGKGTVMLCSPTGGAACPAHAEATIGDADPTPEADAWFTELNAIPCPYPKCCTADGACGNGVEYRLVILGNASSSPPVKTAADCQSLCEKHPGCDLWQLGSEQRGRTCATAPTLKEWKPMMVPSGDKVAGCKRNAGIAGCGTVTPPPPSPPPHPHHPGHTMRTNSLPLTSLLFTKTKRGISLIQDLANHPNNAYLDADGKGSLVWTRQWYRLGDSTAPVQLRRHIVEHEDDWREAVGFMVASQKEAFEVHPAVNRSAIDGGCAFADYRGEGDKRPFSAAIGDGYAETLREMNFQVNWATTANEGESHGTWMPFNLSTGEPFRDGWTTCMGTPDFASCECSKTVGLGL